MLSIKSLINFLEVKQEKLPLDEKNIKLTKPLNKSFHIYLVILIILNITILNLEKNEYK